MNTMRINATCRRWLLWALIGTIVVLIILKIAQVYFLVQHEVTYHLGDKRIVSDRTTPPVGALDEALVFNYGSLTAPHIVMRGIRERIDNFSFWNHVAALIAVLFTYRGFKYLTNSHPELAKTCQQMQRREIVIWGSMVGIYAFVYMVQVYYQPRDLQGTFFCTCRYWSVWIIQRIEGFINIATLFNTYIFAVIAFKAVRGIYATLETAAEPYDLLTPAESFLNVAILPTVVSPLAYVAINGLFGQPLNYASTLSLLYVWYSPYWVLTGYAWCTLPAPYRVQVSIGKSLPKLFWLQITRVREQEIDNPYILGVPLRAEHQELFVGRHDLSSRIAKEMQDPRRPPLLLYGQRRIGKTSLLLNLERFLPDTIIPLFVDLQGPPLQARDHAGFLYYTAQDIVKSASEQRGLMLPLLTRETLQADPFTRFDEWLDEVEQVLGQKTALLILDEFEKLDDVLRQGRFDEAAVLGMLHHLIQHRSRFRVLLAGSHTLDELQRLASYLINVQVMHITYLKEREARQLIVRPVKGFTLRYEPDAIQRVLDLTRSHPYLLQMLCSEIVAVRNEQEPDLRWLVRLRDVEEAVSGVLMHGSFFFADIQRSQVDAAGLAVLRFIAAQGEEAVVSRDTLAYRFPEDLDRALAVLIRRELIEPVGAGYRFQVELIRRWFADEAN